MLVFTHLLCCHIHTITPTKKAVVYLKTPDQYHSNGTLCFNSSPADILGQIHQSATLFFVIYFNLFLFLLLFVFMGITNDIN